MFLVKAVFSLVLILTNNPKNNLCQIKGFKLFSTCQNFLDR